MPDEHPEALQQILDASPCALMRVDGEGVIRMANRACTTLLGYGRSELIGRSVDDLVPEKHRGAHPRHRQFYGVDPVARPMGDGRLIHAERRDGTEVPVEVALSPSRTAEGDGIIVSLVDLSDRIRLEETVMLRDRQLQLAQQQLASVAATDPVTGARNRAAFFEDLASRIALALRQEHPVSLVVLDIDEFKAFNDEHGQESGDELLRRVASIARYTARRSDIVSRTGAAVFTLILPGTDAKGARCCAGRLQGAIQKAEWAYRPITASYGVGTLEPLVEGAESASVDDLRGQLYDATRQALAAAQHQGPDHVVHARDLNRS